MFSENAVQYTDQGIEIKASRYNRGWQGHNPEAIWLLIFTFQASSMNDEIRSIAARSFQFTGVFAASLQLEDWTYAGRSETSRRTITATVNLKGMLKMRANRIYTG